jgi:hypothetical protein
MKPAVITIAQIRGKNVDITTPLTASAFYAPDWKATERWGRNNIVVDSGSAVLFLPYAATEEAGMFTIYDSSSGNLQ